MKERNFQFQQLNSFEEKKKKVSKIHSTSLPELTKAFEELDSKTDLSSQEDLLKSQKLRTIFVDGHRCRQIIAEPYKYEVFSTLKKNGKWEVKETNSDPVEIQTSSQLDARFKNYELGKSFLFRKIDSDLCFKSLNQIISDFCKATEKFEVCNSNNFVQKKDSFMGNYDIFSDDDELEKTDETEWFKGKLGLYFLQNEEYEIVDEEWNGVTRERSKPVF